MLQEMRMKMEIARMARQLRDGVTPYQLSALALYESFATKARFRSKKWNEMCLDPEKEQLVISRQKDGLHTHTHVVIDFSVTDMSFSIVATSLFFLLYMCVQIRRNGTYHKPCIRSNLKTPRIATCIQYVAERIVGEYAHRRKVSFDLLVIGEEVSSR